jgi:SAM-dependent methyltransferase
MTMDGKHVKRFQFEKISKLDSPERCARQPVATLLAHLDLHPGQTVVDLGVGTGYFALPMAAQVASASDGGRVYGVDSEPRILAVLLERARDAGLEATIRAVPVSGVDADPVPLDDGVADLVVAGNLVHELDDRSGAFRQAKRLLRPGGRFVVIDWAPEGAPDWGPPAGHRVAPETVERELGAAGFRKPDRIDLYEDHYVILATRGA